MAAQNDKIEQQVADSLGKMQRDLKAAALKIKTESAKAKKQVEDLKQKLKK